MYFGLLSSSTRAPNATTLFVLFIIGNIILFLYLSKIFPSSFLLTKLAAKIISFE